ncbi:glycosyltransferase [Rhizobium sp. MC63]|uniref:Glycosyltransferase n=1 Tax=Rhizobium mulingense TaxID=3031128 RepID=A0ACC6N764_9HYPH|nr:MULTISPECIES: glycosyltransferase [unclassified Rhizobium]MDF0700188.1 glycosyltransferase [Rhizobium sp. MC63]MEA3520831.1 glycosyltransferase [Rhizobium sp. MJ31]
MTGIKITVLFSTYNGARTLPRMLDALCACTLPPGHWKIVAVDNNSTDDTAKILDSYKDRLPLEVYFEPKQGKENALALGFRHLEGELVVLTDDDVIPDPDWLDQFIRLSEEQPEFSIFGGLILPEWERPPRFPWLLKDNRAAILYALNESLEEGPTLAGYIFGPNSAFRRAVIKSGYVVHDNLGPNASVKQYPMGQDTAFAMRLESAGAKAYHSRGPKVRHIVKSAYVEEDWAIARAERYGMGMVVLRPTLFDRKRKIAGLPASTALLWLALEPICLLFRRLPPGETRFRLLWKQSLRRGILHQFLKQRGARGRTSGQRIHAGG